MNLNGVNIEWFGHSSFKIKANKLIYIDPFQLKTAEKADLILVTHGHYDHCSVADIQKLVMDDSVVIATPDCQSKLSNGKIGITKLELATPGRRISVEGILVEAVSAYNINKRFHQRSDEYVGYVISVGGKRIYHAGDTDFIPEMKQLKNIEVALLPVGGTYTMDVNEAAQAAQAINPGIAVPMHYGKIVGDKTAGQQFKRLLNGKVRVEVLG